MCRQLCAPYALRLWLQGCSNSVTLGRAECTVSMLCSASPRSVYCSKSLSPRDLLLLARGHLGQIFMHLDTCKLVYSSVCFGMYMVACLQSCECRALLHCRQMLCQQPKPSCLPSCTDTNVAALLLAHIHAPDCRPAVYTVD